VSWIEHIVIVGAIGILRNQSSKDLATGSMIGAIRGAIRSFLPNVLAWTATPVRRGALCAAARWIVG
jgi:hypothetical protein